MSALIFFVIVLFAIVPYVMWPILNIAETLSVQRWTNGSGIVVVLCVVIVLALIYIPDYSGLHGGGIIYLIGLLPSYIMVPAGLIVLMGTSVLSKRKAPSRLGTLLFFPTMCVLAVVLYFGVLYFFLI